MHGIDFPPRGGDKNREADRIKREQIREELFQTLVANKILELFMEEFEDAGLEQEDQKEIAEAFSALSEKDKRTVLAIPASIRPGVFKRYAEQVEKGNLEPREIVSDLLGKLGAYGFTTGFHLSPVDVRPAKDGSWVIQGKEKDHRHDDLPMAYYSLDYRHRYLKKPSQYLYVVRIETKEGSGHYRDNDGTWGHAPSLSIIEKVNMFEIEKELDERMNLLSEDKEKGG